MPYYSQRRHNAKSNGSPTVSTNVLTGRLKLFAGAELSMESLLASACLPQLFQAVEVEGKYYWDGGYMGNPTLFPLVHQCDSQDVVVIQINPLTRADVPKTSAAILDRLNEISFNSTFVRELLSLRLVNRLLENKLLKEDETRMRPVFLHMIGAETAMRRLTPTGPSCVNSTRSGARPRIAG